MASRDIVGGIEWCRANAEDDNIPRIQRRAKKAFAGCEIKGKKLGVIGLGAIGAEVANAATHLGMEVYGYDPIYIGQRGLETVQERKAYHQRGHNFQECDYITIHVPLRRSTKGMINKEKLAMMKDGVVILNFSRDTLVNDDDMARSAGCRKGALLCQRFPQPKGCQTWKVILLPIWALPQRSPRTTAR